MLLETYTNTIYLYQCSYQDKILFILYLNNERLFSFIMINFQPISKFYELLLFCLLLILMKIFFVVFLLKILKYFEHIGIS